MLEVSNIVSHVFHPCRSEYAKKSARSQAEGKFRLSEETLDIERRDSKPSSSLSEELAITDRRISGRLSHD